MRRNRSHSVTTFQINIHLLGAVLYGAGAYLLWPDSPEWWGLGVISISLGMAAPAFLIRAIILMFKRRSRDRELDAFETLGAAPKSARLATDDDLENMGVFK